MTPEQAAALTNGGDCFSHWHSEDRRPTQDFLHGLQSVASQKPYDASGSVAPGDDYVVVDSRSGSITLTLPRAVNGIEIEVLKAYPDYVVVILPQAGDTILLTSGVTLSAGNAALRFKAFDTDWRII